MRRREEQRSVKRWRKQYNVGFGVVEDCWRPSTRGSKLER